MADNSVLEFFYQQVDSRGGETAALVKRDGSYRPRTWKELADDTQDVARGLIALGIETGDRVSIISHTRIEWVTTDLGILNSGGVTVPIYPSNLAEECQYVLEHSGSRFVFTENAEQTQKILEERAKLPELKKAIQLEGNLPAGCDDFFMTMKDLVALGKEKQIESSQLDERRNALTPDSILTIIYTSGTTGRPKGVVLAHSAMIYEGKAIAQVDIIRKNDVQLIFLPLAHVFAKVLEIAWLSTGHIMAFAENMTTIKENLGEVRPSVMAGVPRVYERFYSAVVEKATAEDNLKSKLFKTALALSQKNGEAEQRGEALGLLDTIKFNLLKKVIFAKIGAAVSEILGGRMRVMVSGGAPLSNKIAWFFRDADILIVEGYGLTETSAATAVNLPVNNQIGTVGPPVPGTEIKIAEDGEILVKGPGVMREYWKNSEATAQDLKEGWFHTGDIGELDRRTGALRITDRKKDLIVTAGGKNVAPQKIENLLKTHKLISQAVVHGDRRKFLSALITVDADQLKGWAQQSGLSGEYKQLIEREELRREVERLVQESNGELASFETIKKFHILDSDFSIESGELTPKLSVKRKVVNSKYGHIFDQFYTEKY